MSSRLAFRVASREEAGFVLVSSLVLLVVAFAAPTVRRGETDFLSFYAGAKLAGTPFLYSLQHVHEIQKSHANPHQVRAYIRPPFYAALLWPLGKLPYRIASPLWQLLNLTAVALFIWFNSDARVFVALVCCWYLPTWLGLALGQDIAVLLLLVTLAVRLLLASQELRAGLVFSLCSVKFHLFLLLPVLILARRMWHFAAGFIGGAAILTIASFLLSGPNWPIQYLELLRLNERYQASQGFMPNLVGFFHDLPGARTWATGLGLLVVLAVWWVARRSTLEQALASFLTGSLLVSPHAFYYDLSLFIPVVLLLRGQERPAGAVLALASVSILIPLVGRFAVLPTLIWVGRQLRLGMGAASASDAASEERAG